jgi:mannosyltransferase OCH1-like enzyme
MCGLFVLAIVLTALLIATPWLPFSPWNKPVGRFGLVEEPAPMNSTVVVPRIIHQTWKTADVPDIWHHARKECQRLHPGYEFKLWTDASAREMISEDYPEYLALYDGYKYNIQRADAMRLFFLHKYGGIYIDLDIECLRSLDFLRHYGWVMPQTKPVGFSNDFLVGTAGHPFLGQMLAGLPKWNKRFGSKYPTVMFSTGPMFVSYQASHYQKQMELFVLPECLYGKYTPCEETLFKHYTGSTWHGSDASTLKWVFRERLPLLAFVAAAAAALTAVAVSRGWLVAWAGGSGGGGSSTLGSKAH